MRIIVRTWLAVFLLLVLGTAVGAQAVRIKDLANFDGMRGNDLVGYGIVVGLDGTGDSLRNAPYTEEMLVGLLERLGANVTNEQVRPKNVAAVLVTGTLPPFARSGSQIDVSVSAIGDAKSLLGGTLVMTPLNAADGQAYAVAQGSVIAGGVSANSSLREKILSTAGQKDWQVYIPKFEYTTDNAAMIAMVAKLKLERGEVAPLDITADARYQVMADFKTNEA